LVGFRRYAWIVLGYNILVILWGAMVRATGSGAGCGAHWPTCNGEVIPQSPQVETLIEFTHRLTSGLALLLVVGLLVWAWRVYPKGSLVRRAAAASMVFMVIESLVGAVLVLFSLTGTNDSLARAIVIALHLANTFLLLAALSLTAWWASGGAPARWKGQGAALQWGLGLAFFAVLILGMSGAITALGDTLFPAESLQAGIEEDFSPTAHFLIRLRVWHPVWAIIAGAYVVMAAALIAAFQPHPVTRRLAWLVGGLFAVQLLAGLVNLLLLAPLYMQVIHLLLADLLWIALVLFAASALRSPQE
jgi:heme A synthase